MATRPPPETYLRLFQAAAEQEIGLHITCVPEDQQKLVNALYETKNLDPAYADFMLFQPQPPGTIFIKKNKQVELP